MMVLVMRMRKWMRRPTNTIGRGRRDGSRRGDEDMKQDSCTEDWEEDDWGEKDEEWDEEDED